MKYYSKHWLELKWTGWYSIISYISTWIVLIMNKEKLISIYMNPILKEKNKIIFTNITEAFITYIKISLFTSLIYTLPFIIILIYIYIRPALYKYQEKKWNRYILLFFGIIYPIILWILVPIILNIIIIYFSNYELNIYLNNSLEMLLKISDLWSMIENIIIFTGLISLIPFLLFLYYSSFYFTSSIFSSSSLDYYKFCKFPFYSSSFSTIDSLYNLSLSAVSVEKKDSYNKSIKKWSLILYRHYLYFFILFLIAFFTPPDLFSLFLIFIPFFISIEFAIFIICWNIKLSSAD